MGIGIILLALSISVFISAVMFWLIMQNKLTFKEAFTCVCTAQTLNKLLFTSSGYAAISVKLKNRSVPVAETVLSCSVLELFLFLPWIIMGFCFGAVWTARSNYLFFLCLIVLIISAALSKKKHVFCFLAEAGMFMKRLKNKIVMLSILTLCNVALITFYYMGLCYCFGLSIGFFDMAKIAALSTSIGYLSPIPSGLGVKESGFAVLLMQKGITFPDAFRIAVSDRIVSTLFFAVIGSVFVTPIIMNRLKKIGKKEEET